MNEQELARLKAISPGDLAALGLHHVVYVRKQVEGDQTQWAIFAADGTEMAKLPDYAVALAACRQHDLEPLSVH